MKTSLRYLFILFFISAALFSCDDDELDTRNPTNSPITVQFSVTQGVVKESDGGKTITITFSRALAADGNIRISFDTTFAKFFYTTPSSVNGVLTLLAKKNDSNVSFTLSPVNNTIADGNKTLAILVKEVSQGLQVGLNRTFSLTIQDDESPEQIKDSYVNFISSNASIKESNVEWQEIQLHVSEGGTANGSVLIEAQSENAVYGTSYITEPAFVGNTLSLIATPGTAVLKFKIAAVNDGVISGNHDILFKIKETSGNVKKGTVVNEVFKILDDELEGKPKGYESSGGNWGMRTTLEYNANGSVAKVRWDSYTPYHRAGVKTYHYNDGNQLTRINTDPGQDLLYYYEGNRIVKEAKVDNGEIDRYTEYAYDDLGNIGSWRTFHLQPDGNFKLSTVGVLFYYFDGNLYKHLVYTPSNGNDEELYLVSTSTFENYIDKDNPFPMIEVLPGTNVQKRLPTKYRYEANGHDLRYNLSYEFREDGKVSKRTVTGGSTAEVVVYQYY